MKYLDKTYYQKEFDEYTVRFLTDERKADGSIRKISDGKKCYDRFSKPAYKKGKAFGNPDKTGWLDVLIKEQSDRCCYCMRRVVRDEISVEHVLPESFEGLDELQEYEFYASQSPSIRNHVELASRFAVRRFAGGAEISVLTCFPHPIAHGNLTVACMNKKDGQEIGCCCNNHRGNARILPLMLMSDVEEHVGYTSDGTMQITYPNTDNIVIDTIQRLNINNGTLKEVRSIWCKISATEYEPATLSSFNLAQRMSMFKQLFGTNTFSEIPEQYRKYANATDSGTPDYWNLLMQYDWFLDYYRNNP